MKRFKNILCVVNTDYKHDSAMEHAVKLAEKNQACLTVVNVIDDVPPYTKLHELLTEDLKERLISRP